MSRLSIKLILGIVLLILSIEAFFLVLSVNARASELADLQNLELTTYGGIALFTSEYIDSYVAAYSMRVAGLSILIALFVGLGFFFIYYRLLGRFINKISRLNNEESPLETINAFRYIPNDEIGMLIKSRVNMLTRIEHEVANKKRLLRILSHDLANLLTIVVGNIRIISSKVSAGNFDDISVRLEKIRFATVKQKELIDKVRTLDSMKDQKANLELGEYSVTDVLQEALLIFDDRFKTKNISVVFDYDNKDQLIVNTDKVLLLNNVVCNVISNAIKFSYESGTVRMHAYRNSNDDVEFTIRDHGIGMPQAMINELFKGGTGISRAGTGNESGTGFGMLLLDETAGLLGIDVIVTSTSIEDQGEGHGTEFRIQFATGV